MSHTISKSFFETSVGCRFGSKCTHRNEPECAVKMAIESGHISFQRYQNYINLIDEIESQNYWERNKKF
jgi:ribosome biogenesis GTPase